MADPTTKALEEEAKAAAIGVVGADGMPIVRINPDLNRTAREIGEIVAKLDIYQQNGVLLYFDDKRQKQEMKAHPFRTWLNNHAVVASKFDKEGNAVRATLDVTDAQSVLQAGSFLRNVRPVVGLNHVRLPVMRKSGIELLPWGYDKESEIYTVPGGLEYDEVLDIGVAKGWIQRYFGSFPFLDERSMGVQVAAFLSLYVRHLMPGGLRKGFLWRANKPDSGKSIAAKAGLYPVMGHAAAAKMKKQEDLDKELEAFLRDGAPYIFLDNVYGGLQSATLDQLLTSKQSTFRNLGTGQVSVVDNKAQLLVTGNNLEANEDAARRFLLVDLFEAGDPQEREVEALLEDELMGSDEWRGEALAAMYAIVREWEKAGRPAGPTIDRTFPDFSRVLGGLVTCVGYADPMVRPESEMSLNPERADWRRLLEAVVEAMQEEKESERKWTLEDLAAVARALDVFSDRVGNREEGVKLFIKEHGLKGTERAHAEDTGILTPRQRQRWNNFLKGEVATTPTVGGHKVRFGTHEQKRKTAYTIEILD